MCYFRDIFECCFTECTVGNLAIHTSHAQLYSISAHIHFFFTQIYSVAATMVNMASTPIFWGAMSRLVPLGASVRATSATTKTWLTASGLILMSWTQTSSSSFTVNWDHFFKMTDWAKIWSMTWQLIRPYKLWRVIRHPCPNLNNGLTKPLWKLKHG